MQLRRKKNRNERIIDKFEMNDFNEMYAIFTIDVPADVSLTDIL